jgi:small subunit ribosomal protein S4
MVLCDLIHDVWFLFLPPERGCFLNMSKRVNAKYKIDRRLGVNLWGRPKSPFNVRNYAPGEHGKNKAKQSDYCIQLHAKQKLKGYYGNIGEKQFRKIYKEAVRRRGDTSENLIELLERRLDAVVYRMKFAITVFAARQLINHGHIAVNGKRVDIPSCRLKDGDEISIIGKMKDNGNTTTAANTSERDVPDYCETDHKTNKGKFLRAPKLIDVPYPVTMEPNLVIEFYSR